MTSALPDFGSARVLVAGDVMLDRYWTGPVSRISPEAPVPVVRVQDDEARPGGAANVALNAAALGASTALLGVVGTDDAAARLQEALGPTGIEATLLTTRDRPTITKLRVLSRHQQLIRLDFEETLSDAGAFDAAALRVAFGRALARTNVVILSDYGKGTLAGVDALIRAARDAGAVVVVDPKGADFARYRGASVLTPNLAEFQAVVGVAETDEAIAEKAGALCASLDLGAVLVTRSEQGMTLAVRGAAALHLPAQSREVFDVTGAGDTVIATLGAALGAGHALGHAARLANLAAGIVVGKLGTATASVAELQRAIDHGHEADAGVLDEASLLERVAAARARGEAVVMTNGCFDVLHAGHVRYLDAARRLGDVLVLAVNDDASVRRLKGAGRPLNALADRMQVLAALKSVDWVVPFSEDTPARLVAAVGPDRLVKGGDYRPQDVAGHEHVTASGGEVVILDFHDGYSTTGLIDRARR